MKNNILDLRNIKWTKVQSATSPGMLAKTELYKNGKKYFLKLGSYNIAYGFYGNEPLFEVLNSRVGKLLGLPVLDYKLEKCLVNFENREYETYVCISQNYVNNDDKRISLSRFYRNNNLNGESVLDILKKFNFIDDVYKLFLYDFVICNIDRHEYNVEILENINGLRMAPFFDNSFCFIFNRIEDDYKNKVYFNDLSFVNNFIGYRNLKDNLFLIDKPLVIRDLKDSDREYLFKGLGNITTRAFRNYYWWFINRRIEDVKSYQIPFITFR